MSDSEGSDPFEVSGLAGDSAFDSVVEPKRSPVPPRSAAAEKKQPAAVAPGRDSGVKLRALDASNAATCAVCGKTNASDYKFCRGCGSEADVEGSTPVVEPVKKPVVGRGRGTAVSGPLPAATNSEEVKRAVGRARPPPKPPASAQAPAQGGAPTVDRSLSLEERRKLRDAKGVSTPSVPAASPSPTASKTVSTAPVSSSVPSPGLNTSGKAPTVSPRVSRSGASSSSSAIPTVSSSLSAGEEDVQVAFVQRSKAVSSGSFEILESRTADDQTRQFLLDVVRSHEEGIREADEAPSSTPGVVTGGRKPRAPTVRLKGTWSKASGSVSKAMTLTDGSVMAWSSLGLDVLSEHEGGCPQMVFQATQYFTEKRCYNYPGLFKIAGSTAKVNRVMETFADGSFAGFDALEVTPLDVLSSLRSFLLIVPDSPVPSALFYDLLDACYEVDKATQVPQVRSLLMRVSAACRGVLRVVIDLCRKILGAQPALQLGDVAQVFGPSLVRPAEGATAETDSQSYAIVLVLLELGEAAFDSKVSPEKAGQRSSMALSPRAVASAADTARLAELEEESKTNAEKIASLTRQLDEARKGHVQLKKKLDTVVKENGELKRKLADSQKMIDSWKANAVLDMY